jgi:hypothetical protein
LFLPSGDVSSEMTGSTHVEPYELEVAPEERQQRTCISSRFAVMKLGALPHGALAMRTSLATMRGLIPDAQRDVAARR